MKYSFNLYFLFLVLTATAAVIGARVSWRMGFQSGRTSAYREQQLELESLAHAKMQIWRAHQAINVSIGKLHELNEIESIGEIHDMLLVKYHTRVDASSIDELRVNFDDFVAEMQDLEGLSESNGQGTK